MASCPFKCSSKHFLVVFCMNSSKAEHPGNKAEIQKRDLVIDLTLQSDTESEHGYVQLWFRLGRMFRWI